MLWVYYRKNGGQVLSVSSDDVAPWRDDDYFGIWEYPGTQSPDLSLNYWCNGVTGRLATPAEIAAWPECESDDNLAILKDQAKELYQAGNIYMRVIKALATCAGVTNADLIAALDAQD